MVSQRLVLSLFIAWSCAQPLTWLRADEPEARDLLAVKNAIKRAELEILANIKKHNAANTEALKKLKKELSEEEARLKRSRKLSQAAALNQLAADLQDYMVRQVEAKAGPDVWQYNKHTYKLCRTKLQWNEAKQYCIELGGHLIAIEDAAEQNTVAAHLANMGVVGECWIGATDEGKEGNWEWVNGQGVRFTNWGVNEPNNWGRGEHYLQMWIDQGGRCSWNDNAGRHPFWFICEWDD